MTPDRKAWLRGFCDFYRGFGLNENPFDSYVEEVELEMWRLGWDAADLRDFWKKCNRIQR